jgi:hypothetical protein
MITRSALSIGPLAMVARPGGGARPARPNFAALEKLIARMKEDAHRYPPGRRQVAAARLSAAAIYDARAAQAALPSHRDPSCQTGCHQVENGASACAEICLAQVRDERRLQLERGRTPAPRPRSLADEARNYYTTQEGTR